MIVIVEFSVRFRTRIEIQEDQNLEDAIEDIDIPESKDVRYVEDSFDLIEVKSTST